jgi:hypothetical protein
MAYESFRVGLVCVVACLAVACGDDGKNGADGADDGVTDACRVFGALSGGLVHQFGGDAFACSGSGGITTAGQLLGKGSIEEVFNGGSINLTLRDIDPVPALGQSGVSSVRSVTIEEVGPQASDSSQPRARSTWEFAAGTCMVEVKATVKDADTDFDWVWFRAAIECAGSATPVAPNVKAPVSLSDVVVNTFVSAPL